MRLKAVFFDLDGTLIDSSFGIEHSARTAIRQVLPEVELPSLRPFIGPPIREVLRIALTSHRADAARELADTILGELERCFRSDYDGAGWRLSVACNGAAETLSALVDRGVQCCIVTNKPAFSAGKIVDHLGLREYLTALVCRDSRNPAYSSKAEAVADLLRMLEISPDGAVLVGDSEDDADAARGNGMSFIAASYGYGLRNGPPRDAVGSISCLDELPELLWRLDVPQLDWVLT